MDPIVQVKHLSKEFSGVPALTDISVDFYAGKVHVLLGENGAGKSTLIKIISGVYKKDIGSITLEGKELNLSGPKAGIEAGISVIHQELSVVKDLTVAENIYLDSLPHKGVFIDFKTLQNKTLELMKQLNITAFKPSDKMRNLKVADRQMVEIMRAVSRNAKLVIMDEPTSSLSDREIETLFDVIEKLKRKNVAIIFISHKLSEIKQIGDDISILKDGKLITTRPVSSLTENEMVNLMVGREINSYYIKAEKPKELIPVLEVKNLCGTGYSDISFVLNKGEVLGFSGLIGAQRTEVMRAVYGADKFISGEVYVNGELVHFHHPKDSIKNGLGLVPEDRRGQGIYLDLDVKKNISIVSIKEKAKNLFIDSKWEENTANYYIDKMEIKTPSALTKTRLLSGGNQQKIAVAKWLTAESDILILDEPTRGIDVNAKAEIYKLIKNYVESGGSVILVSSELPEIIGVCQRVIVMHNGRITANLTDHDINEETIMRFATDARKG